MSNNNSNSLNNSSTVRCAIKLTITLVDLPTIWICSTALVLLLLSCSQNPVNMLIYRSGIISLCFCFINNFPYSINIISLKQLIHYLSICLIK